MSFLCFQFQLLPIVLRMKTILLPTYLSNHISYHSLPSFSQSYWNIYSSITGPFSLPSWVFFNIIFSSLCFYNNFYYTKLKMTILMPDFPFPVRYLRAGTVSYFPLWSECLAQKKHSITIFEHVNEWCKKRSVTTERSKIKLEMRASWAKWLNSTLKIVGCFNIISVGDAYSPPAPLIAWKFSSLSPSSHHWTFLLIESQLSICWQWAK